MAKETTDKFEIKTSFKSPIKKFEHFRHRGYQIIYQLSQTDSTAHSDSYELTLNFKDDTEKFDYYFCKGEWVTSFTAKIVNSTLLSDEFEVEVVYKGTKKDFVKSFHVLGGDIDVIQKCTSSTTKNLGVLSPYGKQVTKGEKEVLGILKSYIVTILQDAGFVKKNILTEVSTSNEFGVSVIGGENYFAIYDAKLVCIHTPTYKIGFVPVENAQDRFTIMVSYPMKPMYNKNSPLYKMTHEGFGLDRITKINPTAHWMAASPKYTYSQFFLGDPNLNKILTEFFQTIKKKSIDGPRGY